ncbi:methyltransferase [Halioxenophilus aromaticivorans]|uniref:Methyltransferase n=1 Tax=Halioxenophilus aromaticivorans TaxID=1306992 RepID=A0AAV3U8P0_9ALTE
MTELDQNFLSISRTLAQFEHYWRESPYQVQQPRWMQSNPSLAQQCLNLTDSQLPLLEANPEALQQWLAPHLPGVDALLSRVEPDWASQRPVALPSHWHVGIPGRKKTQIEKFAQCFTPMQPHLIDWCCGKGHLGRTLAHAHELTASGLEINPQLCAVGETARGGKAPVMVLHQTDVLDDQALARVAAALPHGSHAVALHACGDLHRRLVQWAAAENLPALSLVPCCYPLWLKHKTFAPLSALAQQHDLGLTRDDLNLAVQEVVTASAKQQQQLFQLNAWRLGFDQLQRDCTGRDEYLATPSLPKSALGWGFKAVCQHLARARNIQLPSDSQWHHYQQQGELRWRQVRRLQLVSQGFRRLLELWLLHDLALCLRQGGYHVALSRFCEREITPRNLLINAKR